MENQASSDTVSITENKSVKGETDSKFETEQDKEAIKKKATLLFLQGKRSIYIKDYQAALASLSESCQLFSQVYPEMDDALADPYFYYGKALLEVGQNESDVLGDQVQDEGNDEDDEDDDEDNEDEDDHDKETETEKNGDSSNKKNGTDSQEKEKSEMGQEDRKMSVGAGEENCEVNDLQLSWEYLELAKLIYLKKADSCKDIAIKLAETYLCLGENGLESENYSVAIEDMKQALELQKKHLKEEDRRIAETYYQLGVAYSLSQNYDEAIESFQKSIEQLEKKISSLEMRKKMGDKKTEEEERDAFYTMDGEINEIKTVIKDVEEKIKDMQDSKNKVKAELIKQFYGGEQPSLSTEGNKAGSSSSPATDISHLIKRKRKNEDDNTSEEKKLKKD